MSGGLWHIAPRGCEILGGHFLQGMTLCGKGVDTMSAYLYPDQVEGSDKDICEKCYDSPDYPLHLLADVGEPAPDPWDGINIGTVTGRLTSSQPNYSNVAQAIKDETRRMRYEMKNLVSQSFLRPIDYDALEKRFLDDDDKD